jgi:hypothetical protein
MYEIIERADRCTLWRSKNAEGQPSYGVTRNADNGTPVEPVQSHYSSLREARKALRWTEISQGIV